MTRATTVKTLGELSRGGLKHATYTHVQLRRHVGLTSIRDRVLSEAESFHRIRNIGERPPAARIKAYEGRCKKLLFYVRMHWFERILLVPFFLCVCLLCLAKDCRMPALRAMVKRVPTREDASYHCRHLEVLVDSSLDSRSPLAQLGFLLRLLLFYLNPQGTGVAKDSREEKTVTVHTCALFVERPGRRSVPED